MLRGPAGVAALARLDGADDVLELRHRRRVEGADGVGLLVGVGVDVVVLRLAVDVRDEDGLVGAAVGGGGLTMRMALYVVGSGPLPGSAVEVLPRCRDRPGPSCLRCARRAGRCASRSPALP